MKVLSNDEISTIADCLKEKIKGLPLISIGLSTGLLTTSSFNCASLAYQLARGRITLSDVIEEAHSKIESSLRSRDYRYRQSDGFKVMYYEGWEPSECLTGSSFYSRIG